MFCVLALELIIFLNTYISLYSDIQVTIMDLYIHAHRCACILCRITWSSAEAQWLQVYDRNIKNVLSEKSWISSLVFWMQFCVPVRRFILCNTPVSCPTQNESARTFTRWFYGRIAQVGLDFLDWTERLPQHYVVKTPALSVAFEMEEEASLREKMKVSCATAFSLEGLFSTCWEIMRIISIPLLFSACP